MPLLKYLGPCPLVEVSGFGHFTPGDEKFVDVMTAASFSDPRCAAEGWVVSPDAPVTLSAEHTTTGTLDSEPRRYRRRLISE